MYLWGYTFGGAYVPYNYWHGRSYCRQATQASAVFMSPLLRAIFIVSKFFLSRVLFLNCIWFPFDRSTKQSMQMIICAISFFFYCVVSNFKITKDSNTVSACWVILAFPLNSNMDSRIFNVWMWSSFACVIYIYKGTPWLIVSPKDLLFVI